jgi:UDPglucose--hexose-1-phosphate uridylyltransferase
MGESKKLTAGIIRNDRHMADGRTIRYYDTVGQARSVEDARPKEEQPAIGELRLDPLVNEWVAMAAHRQGRVFLPPKELCPLCPTTGDLLTEIQNQILKLLFLIIVLHHCAHQLVIGLFLTWLALILM